MAQPEDESGATTDSAVEKVVPKVLAALALIALVLFVRAGCESSQTTKENVTAKKLQQKLRTSISENTAAFHKYSGTSIGYRGVIFKQAYSVFKCPITTTVTRIDASYSGMFEDFELITNSSDQQEIFILSVEPDEYDPDCEFQIQRDSISITFHGTNTEVKETPTEISSILLGKYKHVSSPIYGNFYTGTRDYQFMEVDYRINIEHTGINQQGITPSAGRLNTARFNKSELVGQSHDAQYSEEQIEAASSKILDYILEASEWIAPAAVSKSIRLILKMNSAESRKR